MLPWTVALLLSVTRISLTFVNLADDAGLKNRKD